MIKLFENVDLSGHTLIMPAVAVGNVGQLTLDLLISTIKMKKIGQIFSSCFIPIIGADPFEKDSSELCTSIDIYHSPSQKIVAVQIRAPPVKRLKSFFNTIKDFIQKHKISKAVILTSAWGYSRTDAQLQTEPMRYLATPSIEKEFTETFSKINWLKLEPTQSPIDISPTLTISGGGFALKLFKYLNEHDIPSVLVLKFCSEGDNVPDAIDLAVYLDKWLHLGLVDAAGNVKTIFPYSWDFLFGNPAPADMY